MLYVTKILAIITWIIGLFLFLVLYNVNRDVKILLKTNFTRSIIVEKQENVLENNGSLVNCANYSQIHEEKIHIISSMIFFMDPKYKDNLLYKNQRKATDEEIWDRIKEISGVIQDNLNHEAIGTLHLLVETESAFSFVSTTRFENQSKLHVYRNISIGPHNILNLALRCLPNRSVLYLSQDMTLGEGWSRLNLKKFKNQRVVYVLTRHASQKCITEGGTCMKQYHGSHDAYFFYVDKYLDVYANTKLTGVTIVDYGMEKHIIAWFRNVYKLTTLNPCRQLVTYHQHCVPIREAYRKRQGITLVLTLVPYGRISNDMFTQLKRLDTIYNNDIL